MDLLAAQGANTCHTGTQAFRRLPANSGASGGDGLSGPVGAYVQAEAVAGVWVFSFSSRARRRVAQVAVAGLLLVLLRWAVHGDATGLAAGAPSVLAQVPVQEHLVALTFALPAGTPAGPALTAALTRAETPVTVFAASAFASGHAAVLRALVQAGTEVDALAASGRQVPASWAAGVRAATGVQPLFIQALTTRPPSALLHASARAGLEVVTWSRAPASIAGLRAALSPGAIVKLPVDAETIAALPGVAALLQAAGYTPVTLAELVAVSEGAQGLVLPASP